MITIDPAAFALAYDRDHLALRHDLANEPLLALDAIAALAARHPEPCVEQSVGRLPATLPGGDAPRLDLAPHEIVAGVEEHDSWLVLKNVERDPAYGALVDDLLDGLSAAVPGGEDTRNGREAFLFVSAAGAVTPAHVDPEHNILLQIRGTKVMHVGSFDDEPTRVRELERFYAGAHRNIERVPQALEAVALSPGDAVYVPPDAPHWVQNGDAASVSLSITWRTATTDRRSTIWAANHRLRARGGSPSAPGASRLADARRLAAARLLRLRRRALADRA